MAQQGQGRVAGHILIKEQHLCLTHFGCKSAAKCVFAATTPR
jgi:hypothetical protein